MGMDELRAGGKESMEIGETGAGLAPIGEEE